MSKIRIYGCTSDNPGLLLATVRDQAELERMVGNGPVFPRVIFAYGPGMLVERVHRPDLTGMDDDLFFCRIHATLDEDTLPFFDFITHMDKGYAGIMHICVGIAQAMQALALPALGREIPPVPLDHAASLPPLDKFDLIPEETGQAKKTDKAKAKKEEKPQEEKPVKAKKAKKAAPFQPLDTTWWWTGKPGTRAKKTRAAKAA